ncbi:galaxin isoform X2 [Cyprinodon tularosa]|uniref:galaxin isoform X2 n=1 Tax=Cyprinodon tularosa TaxID=77115 RepID=UPI0018E20E57|nr:galaxin isoform X2 [Cyprinodon tularosa]
MSTVTENSAMEPIPKTQTCTAAMGSLTIQRETLAAGVMERKKTEGLSEKVSRCCGLEAYLPLNEICCNFSLQPRPSPMAECCNNEAFDTITQMCCQSTKILTRKSSDHRCCYAGQYNPKTQCCCGGKTPPKGPACCDDNRLFSPPKELRAESKLHVCGSTSYDPKTERCCQRKHRLEKWKCPSNPNIPTTYDPKRYICCDGCLSKLMPWMDQCCGETPYGLAQRGVLCCKNILYEDREDEEVCSESGVPYKPFEETVCVSKWHNVPGGHCCGEELYQPNKTICCKGNSYNRMKNIYCCGGHAYNISDPSHKCCDGTLYTLKREEENDMQCCGSKLLNITSHEVCCISEDYALSYQARKNFKCCGHQYYNQSLWSCCAGKLSPLHHKTICKSSITKESKLQLVNNLNKAQLCNELYIGVVESVSQNSTVFSSVLKINGTNVTVEPNVFTLNAANQCNFLRLTAGKTYFFNRVDVFTDFNHESVLQSLHFILSKCSQ